MSLRSTAFRFKKLYAGLVGRERLRFAAVSTAPHEKATHPPERFGHQIALMAVDDEKALLRLAVLQEERLVDGDSLEERLLLTGYLVVIRAELPLTFSGYFHTMLWLRRA
jgi:hypothetical protein